jgi:hypothetical protein
MTVVERMARAIHKADDENSRYIFDLSIYEPQARAALTALHDSFADPVVRAAIQAALDEKEG